MTITPGLRNFFLSKKKMFLTSSKSLSLSQCRNTWQCCVLISLLNCLLNKRASCRYSRDLPLKWRHSDLDSLHTGEGKKIKIYFKEIQVGVIWGEIPRARDGHKVGFS